MAHKTNSKEQFQSKLFYFSVTFKYFLKIPTFVKQSWVTRLSPILFKLFPIFETNLFFLKSYSIYLPLKMGDIIVF